MPINQALLNTKLKMHISNIFFFALNLFHLFLASTSTIHLKETGIFRFSVTFIDTFQRERYIAAVVMLVIQFVISYFVLWRRFRKSKLTQINELGIIGDNDDNIRKNLRMDPKKIYDLVIKQAEEYKIRSVKRVYLTDTNIPNALTIDVIPIPFIRISWIVLDANVMEILDEREIKAVIAHELGHVKRYDSVINISRFGINYLVFIAYSLKLLEIIYCIISEIPNAWNIISRIAFLVLMVIILWIFTLVNHILMNFSRRKAELLSDYFAGKRIGKNHIINALILLGQRIDVVTAFGTEFRWLGNREGKRDVTREFLQGIKDLPAEELSKEISRNEALNIYVTLRLKNLRNDLYVSLSDEEIKELAAKASEKLLARREEQLGRGLIKISILQAQKSKLTIDWLLVDKDKDLYLKDEEIDLLINIIRKNPGKELFENDLHTRRNILGKDHPTMRSRILFLHESLRLPKNSKNKEASIVAKSPE